MSTIRRPTKQRMRYASRSGHTTQGWKTTETDRRDQRLRFEVRSCLSVLILLRVRSFIQAVNILDPHPAPIHHPNAISTFINSTSAPSPIRLQPEPINKIIGTLPESLLAPHYCHLLRSIRLGPCCCEHVSQHVLPLPLLVVIGAIVI